MKSQFLALVVAFLLGVSFAACTRLPPSASVLASLHLPAWSSVHSWLRRLRFGSVYAPALLPAPTPVLHMLHMRCGRCPSGSGVISDFFSWFTLSSWYIL